MIALKYLLMILGIGLFGSAGALVIHDVYVVSQLRRLLRRCSEEAAGGGSAGAAGFLAKLQAEARNEATLQIAKAAAQANVIDRKAAIGRQRALAGAEANRIRLTAATKASRVPGYGRGGLRANKIEQAVAEARMPC